MALRLPARHRRISYEQRQKRFPPILCRLLTKRTTAGQVWCPTDEQIADASGLPLAAVKAISYSLSWDDIPMGQHYRFLKGCDIDLENRRTFRRLEWMRKSGYFRHLHRSPHWENLFKPMAEYYENARADE